MKNIFVLLLFAVFAFTQPVSAVTSFDNDVGISVSTNVDNEINQFTGFDIPVMDYQFKTGASALSTYCITTLSKATPLFRFDRVSLTSDNYALVEANQYVINKQIKTVKDKYKHSIYNLSLYTQTTISKTIHTGKPCIRYLRSQGSIKA